MVASLCHGAAFVLETCKCVTMYLCGVCAAMISSTTSDCSDEAKLDVAETDLLLSRAKVHIKAHQAERTELSLVDAFVCFQKIDWGTSWAIAQALIIDDTDAARSQHFDLAMISLGKLDDLRKAMPSDDQSLRIS